MKSVMGTLIGFDANASRSRGVRRIDGRRRPPAECYALTDYAERGDREAARVLTRAEQACRDGAIDATQAAEVRWLMSQPRPSGPDVA